MSATNMPIPRFDSIDQAWDSLVLAGNLEPCRWYDQAGTYHDPPEAYCEWGFPERVTFRVPAGEVRDESDGWVLDDECIRDAVQTCVDFVGRYSVFEVELFPHVETVHIDGDEATVTLTIHWD